MMKTLRQAGRLAWRGGRWEDGDRMVPAEVPVALVCNGTTLAVMMATPADLRDFGIGFLLTEGIVRSAAEIEAIEILAHDRGAEVQISLEPAAQTRFESRRRALVGPVGCGLCGIDSLDEALRPVPAVTAPLVLAPAEVGLAMAGLARMQTLNLATRAVHAAGLYVPGRGITHAREDVGRHNALDKLAGALALAAGDAAAGAATGAIVLTSRVSVDMVQKAAVIGAPVLIAASAPTGLAIDTAAEAGITLVAVARGEEFEVFTHPRRLSTGPAADVA